VQTTDRNGALVRRFSWPIRASSRLRLARRLVASVLLVAGLLATRPAQAAPDADSEPQVQSGDEAPSPAELERARALFQKGVELANQGQFGAAEVRFRGALDIHHAPAVEYNLAAALFELHQYEEAFNRCQSVLRHRDTPGPLRERAQALERALYPHVARLTVIASSASNDLTVRVDGEALDASLLGVPRAVPPGNHLVLAARGELTLSQRSVDVPLRTAAIVDLSLIVAEAAIQPRHTIAAEPGARAERLRDDPQSLRKRRLWFWGGIAAGVVVAGVAVGVGISFAKREPATEPPVAGDFRPGVLTWR